MIQVYKKPINLTQGERQGVHYYAAYSRKGTANSIDLANVMAEGSSAFSPGEVVGVTIDLPKRIKQALLAGQAVHLDGLGTFKPALSVREVKRKPEDLKTSAISIKGINFTPDVKLISDLNAEARYEWINANLASGEDDGTTDAPAGGDSSSSQQNPGNSQQNQGNSQQNPSDGSSSGGNGDQPIIHDGVAEW